MPGLPAGISSVMPELAKPKQMVEPIAAPLMGLLRASDYQIAPHGLGAFVGTLKKSGAFTLSPGGAYSQIVNPRVAGSALPALLSSKTKGVLKALKGFGIGAGLGGGLAAILLAKEVLPAVPAYAAGRELRLFGPRNMEEAIKIRAGKDVSTPGWLLKSLLVPGYASLRYGKKQQAKEWMNRFSLSRTNDPWDPAYYQTRPTTPFPIRPSLLGYETYGSRGNF